MKRGFNNEIQVIMTTLKEGRLAGFARPVLDFILGNNGMYIILFGT